MFRRYYYRKPFIVASILLLTGIALSISGILMESSSRSMDYYALIAFGFFFVITALVIYFMYFRMEKEYRKSIGGAPLLRYTIENNAKKKNVERQVKDLSSTNRGLLMIMLSFCFIFGITLPFILKDGWVIAIICLCLAIFLFLAERIITNYRIKKLRNSTGEYILTENGAVIGGEFHSWGLPGFSLSSVDYIPSDSSKLGILQIEYTGQGLAGENVQRLFLPIPKNHEEVITEIIELLSCKIV